MEVVYSEDPGKRTRKIAPRGKFRVISESLLDDGDDFVAECNSEAEALRIADGHNKDREETDYLYHVYNDEGHIVRPSDAVNHAEKGENDGIGRR